MIHLISTDLHFYNCGHGLFIITCLAMSIQTDELCHAIYTITYIAIDAEYTYIYAYNYRHVYRHKCQLNAVENFIDSNLVCGLHGSQSMHGVGRLIYLEMGEV